MTSRFHTLAMIRYDKPMTMRKTHDIYLADTARVMGQVKMGKDVNLWYGATVRGDIASISTRAVPCRLP